MPIEVHGQNFHTHGQNSGHGNALKPKPEKYVVLPDRSLNAHMSTGEPTPALDTLREHSVRRLQGLDSHPQRGFPVAENAQPCPVPSQRHCVMWNSEKLQCPGDESRASLPGSVSSPQTLPRGPATERPFREICAVCGAAHLLNFRVDGVVQLFVAHIPYRALPLNPQPSRASLHCHREPSPHCPPISISLEARSILALGAPLARHTRPPASWRTLLGE